MSEALQKLRVPFPANQISYLPKGGVKLAYVGHAALTDRLLDVDPVWTWEPLALDERGLPALDEVGGLWIRLTVCGVTRIGYGDSGTKKGGDAMKERIGDALRNAGMRFGAALDLWHKGDLHKDDDDDNATTKLASVTSTALTSDPNFEKVDMSPKARADRMRVGVAAGDAAGVAETLALMPEKEMNEVLALLPADTHSKVIAAWPVTT